ncbi:MAG: phosphate signaling complex protein PhoU [Anaerolineae bacterium]|nr:phosphate signaling complex protein PhoU [Anaerolineae bacterium]
MITEILGTFEPQIGLRIAIQVLLALALGGIVGWDRERRDMPAGIRTYMLVSVGSCLFTILSYRGFLGGDPARVAAQIVSGIGFLGAGVMIRRGGTIYGLTSAAGIWAVAALGMAVGTGNYFLGVFGGAAIYVVLAVLRRWFKADLVRAARRTLKRALRTVRQQLEAMEHMVTQALSWAVRAAVEDDHVLAAQVVEDDLDVNDLRYRIEEACLDILRTHHPQRIQLRTVLAANDVATNLERIGDYAKAIAQIRLRLEHEPLLGPLDELSVMAQQVCNLLHESVDAFLRDDVEAARAISERANEIDRLHTAIVDSITERMTDKKTKHFERGASTLTIAYHVKRAGERATNVAERIVFVRTGALAELDRQA